MKNIYLFLMLIVTSIYVSGQTIVDTTKMWRTKITGSQCNENPMSQVITETIKFSGDTIIDSVNYKKVFRATDEYYTNWNFYLYIREDTSQKVFFRSDTSQQEYLLYDFNPNVGDTITVSSIFSQINNNFDFGTNTMVVDSIDTIFFAGKNRKRICVGCQYCNEEHWIEGIGNIQHGILNNNMGFINSTDLTLLCVYHSDTLIYSSGGNCYQYYDCPNDITQQQTNKIRIYPNPVKGAFFLELPENTNATQLTIANATGQIIRAIPLDKGQTTYQFKEKLPAGIYFVKIQTNNGTVVRKFVKQ